MHILILIMTCLREIRPILSKDGRFKTVITRQTKFKNVNLSILPKSKQLSTQITGISSQTFSIGGLAVGNINHIKIVRNPRMICPIGRIRDQFRWSQSILGKIVSHML